MKALFKSQNNSLNLMQSKFNCKIFSNMEICINGLKVTKLRPKKKENWSTLQQHALINQLSNGFTNNVQGWQNLC